MVLRLGRRREVQELDVVQIPFVLVVGVKETIHKRCHLLEKFQTILLL